MEIVSVVPKDIEVTVAFPSADLKAIYKILGKSIIRFNDSDISDEDVERFKSFTALVEHCVKESDKEDGDNGT